MEIVSKAGSILAGIGVFAFLFWFALSVVLLGWNLRSGFQPYEVNAAVGLAAGVLSAALGGLTTYHLSHDVRAAAFAGAVALVSLLVLFVLAVF